MSDIPDLERIVFFEGELLTADDLTTLDTNNRELRWLHTRSLHNWGIGSGFNVEGLAGATYVSVNPGYAVDSIGREIILSHPVQQPIPAVAGPATYYLVANYVDDANQAVEQQRDASACGCSSTCACSTSGTVRLSNDPAILWKTVAQLVFGTDILLAQVFIQNCALNQNASAAVRRYATCGSMFSLKAFEVASPDINWISWQQGGSNIGFTAAIDTSAAKFQTLPRYTAHIIGARVPADGTFLAIDFVSLANQNPTGFTLQVALPALSENINPPTLTDPITGPGLFNQLGWRVSWMGIEG